jgi:hypothetical protein
MIRTRPENSRSGVCGSRLLCPGGCGLTQVSAHIGMGMQSNRKLFGHTQVQLWRGILLRLVLLFSDCDGFAMPRLEAFKHYFQLSRISFRKTSNPGSGLRTRAF